jgi:hypothetical protein
LVSLSLIEKPYPQYLLKAGLYCPATNFGRIAVVFIIIDEIADPFVIGETEYAIG